MKILAIVGSNTEGGVTERMLSSFLAPISELNTIEIIKLQEINLKPDRLKQPNTDLRNVIKKMKSSDLLVFASPTYYGNISGIMKMFLDDIRAKICMTKADGRTIPRPEFKGKPYFVMTNCFVSSIENICTGQTDQTFKSIDKAMSLGGMHNIGEFVVPNIWRNHGRISKAKEEKLNKLGFKIIKKVERENQTVKRYIQLFIMVAVMALVTMILQNFISRFISLSSFWLNYVSFVLIFFVLLAIILHIVTFNLHKRS